MADDVHAAGEVGQEVVAIAVHHLGDFGIPKGVFVVGAEMHGTYHMHVLVVDGLPVEDIGVEGEYETRVVVGFVDGLVSGCLLALDTDNRSGKVGLVGVMFGIVHGTVSLLGSVRGLLRGCESLLVGCVAMNALGFLILGVDIPDVLKITFGASAGIFVYIFAVGNVLKHVVGHDALALVDSGCGLETTRRGESCKALLTLSNIALVHGEGIAGRFADRILVGAAVGNSGKQVGRHDVADVVVAGRHLGYLHEIWSKNRCTSWKNTV